ncbi:MAG: hypothetical protein GX838_03425 [Clostridiaceae bacterium]|nr:hypothetical protein [Clostridiaceae bacterium]
MGQAKPTVVLIDQYDLSVSRLAERLRVLAESTYDVVTMPPGSLLPDHTFKTQASLMIDPCSLKEACLAAKGSPIVLCWGEASALDIEGFPQTVPRFGGARRIDRMIRHHLSDQIGRGTPGTGHRYLGCHLSFSQGKGEFITRHVINKEMSAGRQVVYLPVKPLYLLTDDFRRGPGQTAGDLLCLIASGDLPKARDLGCWLYLHEGGYMTFRLPDRADDLTACDSECLKQLVHLCGSYARTCTESTMVWLDTAGLLLGKLSSIAVLCDHVYVDIPPGDSSAALMARRELGIFLAALPQSCAILEHPTEPVAAFEGP